MARDDLKLRALLCIGCVAFVAAQDPLTAQVAQSTADAARWSTRDPALRSGRVEERAIQSAIYGSARRVWVYTPPGFDPRRPAPFDALVVFDGREYTEDIQLPTILDNLIAAKKIQPVVAIFIDNDTGAGRISQLANSARFANFLATEVMPWARREWHITSDPRHTTVAGSSAGGLAAAYVAYRRPDVFGNVLAQSGAFWRGNEGTNGEPYEWLTEQFRQGKPLPLRFYIEVGALETGRAVGVGPVFIDANRRLRDVLQSKGYTLSYTEVPGARHEQGHWRTMITDGLIWLLQ